MPARPCKAYPPPWPVTPGLCGSIAPINDLYPPSAFNGPSSNPSLADRLLIYNGTGYDIYWLYLNGGNPHWTLSSTSALADNGSAILDPCGGWFVHPKAAPATLIQLGGVRAHDMVLPHPRRLHHARRRVGPWIKAPLIVA